MQHSEVADVIANTIIPSRSKAMLWGPPGIGKTALVEQVADRLTRDTGDDWALRVWDMSYLYDPADSRGIPTITTLPDGTKVTQWIRPEHMVVGNAPTIILLDDLPTLPMTSMANCLRLIQHGEIGGVTFGPNVHFLAAGNRMGDNSATNSMPFALANRFWHANVSHTLDGWTNWALAAGIETELIAYHRFTGGEALYPIYNDGETQRPCGLCKEPVQPNAICPYCVKRSRALPSLRTWGDGVNKKLRTKPDPALEMEIYAGDVGKEKAAEFCGYLRMFRQIPSIDGILMAPNAAPVPTEPSTLYAVACSLGRKASVTNIDAVVEYLERWHHHEIAAVAIKDAIRRTPDVQNTRAVISWQTRHQNLLN